MTFLSAVVSFFFDLFFGCRHERQTRPFTLENETYKVCLECGKQLFYSPVTMRLLSNRELKKMRQARAFAMPTVPAELAVAADGKITAA